MARIMRCRLPPQVSRQPATMTARLTKRTAHGLPQLHCLRSSPAGAHGSGLQRSGAYDAYVWAARDTARGGA